jgi:two-component system phosphate regulon sensor histidine kinase PhoR
MTRKLKKSYRFALRSSLYITLFTTTILEALLFFFKIESYIIVPILFFITSFAFCFFIIQYRVERFIYKRVKKIYDDVTLLDVSDFQNHPITTDMATLTKEIEKFATNKKLEIETLKIRENYRK